MRQASDEDAAQMLNDLRDSGNSINIDPIIVEHRGTAESDPSAHSPIAATLERPLRSRFVSSLCDAPHLKVRATPWTTVTTDDDLISHLVSLWFTWHPPYVSWIIQDLFIRDMLSGNTATSPFCSKFLVNVICAQACVSTIPDPPSPQWSRS